MEQFSLPGASAIIEKSVDGVDFILIQERYKEGSSLEDGLLEIPAGKVREFENIYDTLRREIFEETGLKIVEIQGEEDSETFEYNGYRVISYKPFASSQNIKGSYPIMVQAFLCRVEGELLKESNESRNIRWVPLDELRELLDKRLEVFYPMHISSLRQYMLWVEGGRR